ncbi:heavy metal translocating P-type ATPase [Cupriavidus sp. L7L]|uniref:heavy metal translocating P-type ATPase n=1 Tax=Cupriavidus sp. L7L TaxID=2546443 RepID=UPI0010565FC6|nr:heavy metal translocating P-type ATPase [Cupriavidus sp. L7L]TDF63553.1 heavy metal translocating P-type ATPase [Cupriavidus sp. L7L]
MPIETSHACSHCQLPVGRLGQQRELDGEAHWFCCYGCCLAYQVHHGEHEEPQAAAALIRFGVGGFLAMNVMLFSWLLYADAFTGDEAWLRGPVHWLLWALATPLVLLLGRPFAEGAWQAMRQGRLSTDTLVCIGVLAAYCYSGWQVSRGSSQVYFDTAAMVLLLFTLGRLLEAQVRVRTARRLAPMLAAERAEARVVEGGTEGWRAVVDIRPGELVRILPGERVPVDGIVVDGRSECDEAVLTGQSEPQFKPPGALVHAGSINGSRPLLVRATVAGSQTRWQQIGRQVREALARKSLAGDTVDRIIALFIPGVLALAAASAWFWGSRAGAPAQVADAAMLAGLAVLVVACPCSLGLAAPLTHALAIGLAAQRGILVRGGDVLERLARLKGIAFDKTGTLTADTLHPVGMQTAGASHAEVLRVAAALAQASDHPAARAIAAMARAAASPPVASNEVEANAGEGLCGRFDGMDCALGSPAFLGTLGWHVPPALLATAPLGCTLVLVGWEGQAHGLIALRTLPMPHVGDVIGEMQRQGLRTLLLSGDNPHAVAALAGDLHIDAWQARLLPQDKVLALRDWAAGTGLVAMVGDGLNDSPVLAAASVGIAVGNASDLARESADVVLPRSGLASLPWLLQQARQVRRTVRANLAWAFGYNAIALALAAGGLLQPVLAAVLMAGSSVLVAMRSWRASATAEANAGTAERAGATAPGHPAALRSGQGVSP